MANPPAPPLPSSYTHLPYTQIRLTHQPPSSLIPTPVILLTLHRPAKHNAFTNTMMRELEDAFGILDRDDRVRVVVLTGSGRMFCAGADLEEGLGGEEGEGVEGHRDGGGRVALAIHRCRKPTIAAINGSAVGVGITMTLPCAIRLSTSRAKIGFVFARRGIVMEACSSYFLPRLIGYSRALHLVTTGATYPASSPLLSDLFSELLETGERVLGRALEVAEEVAANTSVVSTALMREMMWRGPPTVEESHKLESRVLAELFQGRDKEEGIRAFMEKRKVDFQGTMGKDAPSVYPWWEPADVRVEGKVVSADKSKL